MNVRKAAVRVPASTANLGPGFDTLGMALDLYAWIEMSPAETTRFSLHGDGFDGIPTDKSNLIYQVAQSVFAEADARVPELEVAMYSDIPLARGLGSSASAIVGALTAANAMIGSPLSTQRLFEMATALEKHPDNVGPSLFGGIVAAFWDGERAEAVRIEPPAGLEALVAIPDFLLETEKARHILPKEVSMRDAVFNVGHSSLLVAAFCTGRLDMIRHAMKDALHQPYRSPLVPGMTEVLERATDHGALGIALSGAGPTLLALVDANSHNKNELERFLLDTLHKEDVSARTLWLKPSAAGAVEIAPSDERRSFMEIVKGEVRA